MHKFFTYIIVVFSEIQKYSRKMNNYNRFKHPISFQGAQTTLTTD